MSHVLISAAHKSSGKTTVTVGLCAALRAEGRIVQPFKKGPDYIDPMWLGRAAGRPCYNLDFYTASEAEILQTVSLRQAGSDIAVIEGNKGLHDGLDLEGTNSNAALAKLLGAPVILVLDVRGTIRGVAPLLLGYQSFDPEVQIAGVILNQVGGERHEGKLRAVIAHYTDVPVLGAVRRDSRLALVERHLGLMPSNEDERAESKVREIGERIADQVDLDAVRAVADCARPLARFPAPHPAQPRPARELNIGIARDGAFGFYYPDDLEALEAGGARLVPIDTLGERCLPHLDGLFIGGGFPETQMAALERNVAMRQAIREAIEGGLPTYAECGGLMYLTRRIRWKEAQAEMVGVIPADTVMCDTPQGRGYVRLRSHGTGLWPPDPSGAQEIAAHEFHYSRLEGLDPGARFAYDMVRGHGIDGRHDGLIYKNLLASYTHLRDTGQHHWTRRFLAFVRRNRGERAGQSGCVQT